jgi:Tfp pilus assembly protein PilX
MNDCFRGTRQQRGAALLVLITVILLASSYTLLKKLNTATPDIVRSADSARVLGEAKAALIG